MANQEHLDILRQGVQTWNQWRKEHLDIQPDLSGATLWDAHLEGADLSEVYLWDATLWDAKLGGANLREAHLNRAGLSRADLRKADLSDADLSSADLSGADLKGANLRKADLSGTHLSSADLSGADLSYADLKGANLRKAKLYKAKLNGANLSNADLSDANLRLARSHWDGQIGTYELTNADLRNANLSRADLSGAGLSCAILSETDMNCAKLWAADLSGADLNHANLSKTNFHRADLRDANLSGADLRNANLSNAELRKADLSGADLSGADLSWACFVHTNLKQAKLNDCLVYGIAAWDIDVASATQSNLVITPKHLSTITVDNLEIAQFIYLLLNNQKLRQTIDTITSQVVLLLGNFPPERKDVVDALSIELHRQKYSPVIFNVAGAENKGVTATVRTLANMARFVLIDLTGLDDTIREIADAIIPHCVVPIRPLLLHGSHRQGYDLFQELGHKPRWVLAPYRYKDLSDLQSSFQEKILQPINEKIIELQQKKPLKVFIGYAPEDIDKLKTLKTHLHPLERAGLIELWDDQHLLPGEKTKKEIESRLSDAHIILLLLSPDSLGSHDCSALQSMALERHGRGEARVIPILLRPCAWQSTPLKELQPLPKDRKPISKCDQDEIFLEVSADIGEVIKLLE